MEAERTGGPRTIEVKTSLTAEEFVAFQHWAESIGLDRASALRMLLKIAMAGGVAVGRAGSGSGPSGEP